MCVCVCLPSPSLSGHQPLMGHSCSPPNSLPQFFVAPQIPLLPQPLSPGLMGRGGGKVPWQSRACLFLVNEDHN